MIREPRINDAKEIQALVRLRADEGIMLHRSLNDIYEQLRDFTVYEKDEKIVGISALHIVWEDVAELRSLAVATDFEKQGIGKALVGQSLEQAEALGVKEVFVLTYLPDFFLKLGFHGIDKQKLPHKIWNECIRCHKYPDCDETALSISL